MKKKINFIKMFILVSALALVCTACADINKETEAPDNSANTTQATENATKATEIATQPTEEATQPATEDEESAELKIMEAIHDQFWGDSDIVTYDDNDNRVGELTNRYLGAITSQEDAVEKGQTALIELFGREDNYYEYKAEFKEEYGVWLVGPTFPPATCDENGKCTATLGTVMYIVIRESDGKALGTFCG